MSKAEIEILTWLDTPVSWWMPRGIRSTLCLDVWKGIAGNRNGDGAEPSRNVRNGVMDQVKGRRWRI